MATRSRIGITLDDGSILSAYHHWDGYPEWLGRILKTHYNTRDKASELIDGGDMSSCWTKERWDGEKEPYIYQHTESEKYGAQYYTQRGESLENNAPQLHKDLNEFLVHTDDMCGGEYAYQFINGEWVCYQVGYAVDKHMVKQVEIPSGELAV